MEAKLINYANGRWAIEVTPETDIESRIILNASGHVWEVQSLGAMLIMSPTEKLKDVTGVTK